MRNFIVTIDGKSYSVGVEEVGVTEKSESRHEIGRASCRERV